MTIFPSLSIYWVKDIEFAIGMNVKGNANTGMIFRSIPFMRLSSWYPYAPIIFKSQKVLTYQEGIIQAIIGYRLEDLIVLTMFASTALQGTAYGANSFKAWPGAG